LLIYSTLRSFCALSHLAELAFAFSHRTWSAELLWATAWDLAQYYRATAQIQVLPFGPQGGTIFKSDKNQIQCLRFHVYMAKCPFACGCVSMCMWLCIHMHVALYSHGHVSTCKWQCIHAHGHVSTHMWPCIHLQNLLCAITHSVEFCYSLWLQRRITSFTWSSFLPNCTKRSQIWPCQHLCQIPNKFWCTGFLKNTYFFRSVFQIFLNFIQDIKMMFWCTYIHFDDFTQHHPATPLPLNFIAFSDHLKVGKAVRCVTSQDSNQFLVPGHTERGGLVLSWVHYLALSKRTDGVILGIFP
jgi:hypothetical protein